MEEVTAKVKAKYRSSKGKWYPGMISVSVIEARECSKFRSWSQPV